MSIKKITELEELTEVATSDVMPIVDTTSGETKKIQVKSFLGNIIQASAAAHNAIYRGVNVTDLFYDGTLSEEIAAGTFDDVFPGDYIIGQSSGNVYIVGDLDYRYMCGDTELTTHHMCMFPLAVMGSAQMNSSNITTGAYIGSEMYTTNLAAYKTIIQNDFEVDGTTHLVTHRNHMQNAVTNGYPSGGTWYDSTIELMNENMVYGNKKFAPMTAYNGSSVTVPNNYEIDKTQLSVFRHRPDYIIGRTAGSGIGSTTRNTYWLRDVVSSTHFALVVSNGACTNNNASNSYGVRPAFLIK